MLQLAGPAPVWLTNPGLLARPRHKPTGADFDGSTAYMTRGGGLTGAADGRGGTIAFSARIDGGNGSNLVVMRAEDGAIFVRRLTTGVWQVFVSDTAGAATLVFPSVATYNASTRIVHVMAAWNTDAIAGSKTAQLYVDNVADLGSVTDASAAFDIDYTSSDWTIGANNIAGAAKFHGAIFDLWFDPTFFDLSRAANRRRLIGPDKRPAFLGVYGERVLGRKPLIFAPGPWNHIGRNRGTGGDFTLTGSVTPAVYHA